MSDVPTSVLDGYVDRPTLARQLRVRPETISLWVAKPDGLPHIKFGRSYYFKVEAVRQWLERRTRVRNQIKARAQRQHATS